MSAETAWDESDQKGQNRPKIKPIQPTSRRNDARSAAASSVHEVLAGIQLNAQIERKDEQIMTMLERDRETNILIHALQETLSQVTGLVTPERMRLRDGSMGDTPTRED